MTEQKKTLKSSQTLLICVNYRTHELCTILFESISRLSLCGDLTVMLVNNDLDVDMRSILAKLGPLPFSVEVIDAPQNLGYFGGAQLALDKYLENSKLPEWIILSNPDIAFPDSDFLAKLYNSHSDNPPAVVAPAIISSRSGKDQNPHFVTKPSKLKMRFYKWVFRSMATSVPYHFLAIAKAQACKRFVKPYKSNADSKPIYAPHGSFIVFNKMYFTSGGDFKHFTFLFAEEIYVAETAKRAGLTIVYDPELTVTHVEHASTGILPNRTIYKYIRESSAKCVELYF